MGTIQNIATEDTHALDAEHTIGRSRTCALCIASRQVSGEHAVIRWTRGCWELRDLGSSNGTFLNGDRLKVGIPVVLIVGARIVFGDRGNAFQLVDAGPPPALARADDREIRSDEDGLLVLPDPDNPILVIAHDRDGAWTATREDGGVHIVRDQDVVEVGGCAWALSLPVGMAPTLPVEQPSRALDQIGLRFTVSRDEEDVHIDLLVGGERERLEPRAYGYTMLTLARARIADQANIGLSVAEHGWVSARDLARQLRLTPAKLRLDIHRARKQLEQAGVSRVDGLVERQPVSRKMRIGVGRLEVRRVDQIAGEGE